VHGGMEVGLVPDRDEWLVTFISAPEQVSHLIGSGMTIADSSILSTDTVIRLHLKE
jgi:hypothetical protein